MWPPMPRLPDFVIIGARKCGTTSLYQWLREQPELFLPAVKEPAFFSRDHNWRRGLEWYGRLFSEAGQEQFVGEASAGYTSPEYCEVAAGRMAATLPEARLIYLIRHPLNMIRSQYRHQVQRAREPRGLLEALREPGNPYLGHSMFFRCLSPYIEAFPRPQICVTRLEDLVGEPAPGWSAVLRHLGVPDRPAPPSAHNVGARKPHYRPMMAAMERAGLLPTAVKAPRPVRTLGKAVLTRSGAKTGRRLEESMQPVPEEIMRPVWEDVRRLEAWLGVGRPLWEVRPA